jgi:glycosyltransferase involved in cell wall biosynthesis
MPQDNNTGAAGAGPFVSVVVCCYNSGPPLADALRSVAAQTWPAGEIIVVDDGSKPEPAAFIESTVRAFPGVKLAREPNRGPSGARNRGVQLSRGDYVVFLDHDDLWAPTLIEKLATALGNLPRAGCVFCRIEHMRTNGERTGRVSRPQMRGFTVKDLLLHDPACCGSSFMVKKDAFTQVGGFPEDLRSCEAPELFIRFLLAGWEIEGIDDVLVYYRNSPGGLSKKTAHADYHMQLIDRAVKRCPELGSGRLIKFQSRFNEWKARVRSLLIR